VSEQKRGILYTLAELTGPSVVTLGDVRMPVGQSDKDAAGILLRCIPAAADKNLTIAQAEAGLIWDLLTALDEWSTANEGHEMSEAVKERKINALTDALFWFKFLTAVHSIEDKEAA